MGTKDDKTEVLDVKLPRDLVKQLTSEPLMRMLETLWLDAFSRGAEFGMSLISRAKEIVAADKKSKRRKPKGKRAV